MADLRDACGDDPEYFCEKVLDWTGSENAAEVVDAFLWRPARIVLIVVGALIIVRLVRRAIGRFVARIVADQEARQLAADDSVPQASDRAAQRARTLGIVLRSSATVVIWLTASLMVLGEFNVDLAPLLAGAGIAGVALGFGAQTIVRDFLAGLFFLVEDQFGVGDVIDVGEASGTVEEVTLRTTRLRDVAGVLWIVPNGEIQRVGNQSQLWSNSLLDLEVAYDTDVDHAMAVIKEVLDELWHENLESSRILEEPRVLGVESFGPDAVVIRAVVKTEPAAQFQLARVIRGRLKKAFDDAGIEIPFPQRTVWIRSEATA